MKPKDRDALRFAFADKPIGWTAQLKTLRKVAWEDSYRDFIQSGGRMRLYEYEYVTLTPELAAELGLSPA